MMVYETICDIIREKEEKKRFPTFALSIELIKRLNGKMEISDIKKEIMQLKRENKIKIGETINYKFYEKSNT
jgi:hypothetical protein